MLDIQTLVLINCIINFFNTFVLLLLWKQYRTHFPGLHFLLLDMGFQTTGFLLSLLRNQIPAIISIVLSNVLIMTGALFVLVGLEIFFQKKGKHTHNIIMLALFAIIMTYFALIHPSLFSRELCISSMLIIINTQTCWLLLYRIPKKARRISAFTAIILLTYVISSMIRIVYILNASNHPNDFFSSGVADSIPITLYLVLGILITISFVALVSRRLLEEIQVEKEKYNTTFHTSPSAILLTRLSDGTIIEVNDGFQRMMGYQSDEVIGKTTIEIKLWKQESDRDAVMGALYLGKDVVQQEIQFQNQHGDLVFGLLSSKLIEINNERCIITNISNVTEMVIMRQDLHDLATHDNLTGLPNRILFYDRFEIAKANAQRENEKIAVISMDIDFLKRINDDMGHAAGDVVLATVSSRMSNLLRKVDSVARFGGDEFAFLIWGMKQIDDVKKVVENLQRTIAEPITIGAKIVSISVSMGIAMCPEDGTDIIELLKLSDDAMYQAKRDGRNNAKFSKDQSKMKHFMQMLCGEFDNQEQCQHEELTGIKTHPQARHTIDSCNGNMVNLPENFHGYFVIEESYFDLGTHQIEKHYLFLYEMISDNQVRLSSYNIPQNIVKETFVNSNPSLTIDYTTLEISPRFSPLILESVGENFVGENVSAFSADHLFKFRLEVTEDALYVTEILEKQGELVAGYYEPIIYKKTREEREDHDE